MLAVCIVNPKASDGACLRKWPLIESSLKRLGIDTKLVSRKGDLRTITAETLAETADSNAACDSVLAAVGGDGTQHAVVNGIARFKENHENTWMPPYVPIPMGTGNNIAKSLFDFPLLGGRNGGVKAALRAIVDGTDRDVDLGMIRSGGECAGTFFLDAFSIGADAAVLAAKDESSAKLAENHPWLMSMVKGYPLYAWHGFGELLNLKPVEATVVVDSERWYSGPLFNIVVNDTAIYGGEFDITGTAFPDDGKLDAMISTSAAEHLHNYLRGFRRFPRTVRRVGTLSNGQSALKSGKTFEITMNEPRESQIDGELGSPDVSFVLTTISGALKIRV